LHIVKLKSSMAKFEIQGGNMTDKQFRKELRKYGLQYRRWGTLKILCAWPNYRDAKSKKQLACRERFKKAQKLMMEDFKSPENDLRVTHIMVAVMMGDQGETWSMRPRQGKGYRNCSRFSLL
jgi:hypothetical protein